MQALKNIADYFLIFCLLVSFYFVYLILKPFIWIILLSAMMVVIFYPIYELVLRLTRNHKNIASAIMTLLIVLIILIPVSNFVLILSQKSFVTYNLIEQKFSDEAFTGKIGEKLKEYDQLRASYLPFINLNNTKDFILSYSSKINAFLISSTTGFIKGTTQFITTLFLIILTIFFFFRDGSSILRRLMYLTPLPNKYDKELFKKFHDISFSTIVSSLLTAIVQGLAGGIGFYLIGVPAFFIGIAMAFASLIPVGSVIIWLPAGLILMITGRLGAGLFILVWGALVVGLIDNLLRPFLIRSGVKIHPLFIFFSFIGGIAAFGFWGLIFGPVILAIALTFVHIFELEYQDVLNK